MNTKSTIVKLGTPVAGLLALVMMIGWASVVKAQATRPPVAKGVDPDIARAAVGRSVVLQQADGSRLSGIIISVTADAIILQRRDGQLVKVPLADVLAIRVPPRVTPSRNATAPGRGAIESAKPRRLRDMLLHFGAALRLRNTGLVFTIVGAISGTVAGALWAVKNCDSGDCDVPRGTKTMSYVFAGVGGLFGVLGLPMLIAGGIKASHYGVEIANARRRQKTDASPRHRGPTAFRVPDRFLPRPRQGLYLSGGFRF